MQFLTFRFAALGIVLAVSAFTSMSALAAGSQDATFVTQAAQAGMTEVQLAAVALKKSTNAPVLAFAQEMQADHSKANAELTSIVAAKGMSAPSDVGTANAMLVAKLRSESGTIFDAMYLKSQLPAHRKVLALFKAEAANGTDPDLVAFAKKTIPVIKSHIAMDKRDLTKVGSAGMSMGNK